jgi:hypothetical protein
VPRTPPSAHVLATINASALYYPSCAIIVFPMFLNWLTAVHRCDKEDGFLVQLVVAVFILRLYRCANSFVFDLCV